MKETRSDTAASVWINSAICIKIGYNSTYLNRITNFRLRTHLDYQSPESAYYSGFLKGIY